ncbi:histidine kinase [Flagellimonas sp. DF-77]|uniref:sensor histidine kinase n=1 Tax=Flagellimonas algarum TaxID=3230298 RepID=UPI0033927778
MKKTRRIKEVWIHVIIWICFLSLPLGIGYAKIGEIDPNFLPRAVFNPIFLVYINYLYLVPKFLLKKKLWTYLFLSVLIIVVFNTVINRWFFPVPIQRLIDLTDGLRTPEEDFRMAPLRQLPYAMTLIFSLAFYLLGGILGLTKDFYRRDRMNREILVQKKETELEFLKAQLNPHFLFNSLNGIYSMVRNKSREAPEAVIALSELMRYMLYETKGDVVPLSKEIDYIKNYVQLQRYRLQDCSEVKLAIKGEYQDKKIPPLLLIPFVENAFKYGTNFKGLTDVKIRLEIIDNDLFFSAKNRINDYRKDKINSGIGLKNIANRLQLLFPDNHALKIDKENGSYLVELEINLAT